MPFRSKVIPFPGDADRGGQRSVTDDKPAVRHPPSFERGQIDDPKLSAALRQLELTVKRKLDGVPHGDHLD